jgi:3'(2'), 5'-bisphosphate nucleotidase
MSVSVVELLGVCVEAAERACKRIREIRAGGDLGAIDKGDGKDAFTGRPMVDIQTEADRQSEKIIFSVIKCRYPEMKVVGEEESSGPPLDCSEMVLSPRSSSPIDKLRSNFPSDVVCNISELSIFVDPLDGTSEFVHNRLHCVSVIIGIARNGTRLAGVIARPFPDETVCADSVMYGIVGLGVFIDHLPFHKPTVNSPNGKPIVTTTLRRSHRIIERLFELCPCEIIKEGGAGYKFWLTITGKVDSYVYPRPGTKKWDVLAGDAILSALGGVTTDACGRTIRYDEATYGNDWGLIASYDRHLHFRRIVAASHQAIAEAVADRTFDHWPSGLDVPSIALESSLYKRSYAFLV